MLLDRGQGVEALVIPRGGRQRLFERLAGRSRRGGGLGPAAAFGFALLFAAAAAEEHARLGVEDVLCACLGCEAQALGLDLG